MGGTEIIYLPDNKMGQLSDYFELMALENMPYDELKARLIAEFGLPVTDYSALDFKKPFGERDWAFFLDNFEEHLF